MVLILLNGFMVMHLHEMHGILHLIKILLTILTTKLLLKLHFLTTDTKIGIHHVRSHGVFLVESEVTHEI
jgi:hypothetical protein